MEPPTERLLIVMRHSKAESKAATDDHGRRLTGRGAEDADAAGQWLLERRHVPEHVLVSTATRARSTLEHVAQGLGLTPPHEALDELYEADAYGVLAAVNRLPATVRCALVVGHNPAMEEFVHLLQRQPERDWPSSMPTSGVAVLAVTSDWVDVEVGGASLVDQRPGSAPRRPPDGQ